jgi:hypothetical protein
MIFPHSRAHASTGSGQEPPATPAAQSRLLLLARSYGRLVQLLKKRVVFGC